MVGLFSVIASFSFLFRKGRQYSFLRILSYKKQMFLLKTRMKRIGNH